MIKSNRHISKGQILGRMRRVATNMFGINHSELLDPIVNLLLESLSEEIYKIAGEIENIEDRILDKLTSILAPTTDTIAQPAHCILHAATQEDMVEATTETGFQYYNKNLKRNFSFYPVCNTNIRKGQILYYIYKGVVYTIDRDLSKTLYVRSLRQAEMDDNTFWLGLDLSEGIEDISGLSFYFDLNGVFEKDRYLNLLPYTTWSIGGETLTMNKGISFREEEHGNITRDLFAGYDLSNKINRSVKDFYHHRYLTIAGACPVKGKKEVFPNELVQYFPENSLSSMDKPLIWVKIACPQRMTSDIISTLQPAINTLPVVNKELVSKITEIGRTMPVIPLNAGSNESFISVHKVSDSSGKMYYDVPLYDDTDASYGIYSLRRGGMEHYSNRDAEQYLAHITDALSWEVSSSFKNQDDAKSDLKKIEGKVNRLIRQLRARQAGLKDRYELENYLLLPSPEEEHEIYFVDYWVTNGEQANAIRPGSIFLSESGAFSAYSLNQSLGGKYAPGASQKEILHRSSMEKHSLLITDDDILNFCCEEFKESIGEAKVRRGFMESGNLRLGFVETTDVYLKPLTTMKDFIHEKENEYYLQALKERSPATFNYRIFIKETL